MGSSSVWKKKRSWKQDFMLFSFFVFSVHLLEFDEVYDTKLLQTRYMHEFEPLECTFASIVSHYIIVILGTLVAAASLESLVTFE